MSDTTYTYRGGKKVPLRKRPDQFVTRVQPQALAPLGVVDAERVSGNSSRATVRPVDLESMMTRARQLGPTHHSYELADTGEEFLISDRIFVRFRAAPGAQQIDELAARYALVLLERYSDKDFLFQLTDHTGMNPVKLVVTLTENEPALESADHDLNRRAQRYELTLPADPFYQRAWHLNTRLADPMFDPRACSRCEEAWRLLDGFGSRDVVIGVTDDGCKVDHPDFDSPGKFASWGYFRGTRLVVRTDIDANPAEMHEEGSDHGTSCAGVIAGEADAVLAVGAAPNCRLLPIKWESDGPFLMISDSKLLTAVNYVADKVDVLSNSWGSTPTNLTAPVVIDRIAALARTGGRRGRGIVFLWAAGNENCPIQHVANVDVPFDRGWQFLPDGSRRWVGVHTSRRFENNLVGVTGVVHVAAVASDARRSHYSNYGTGIGISAPTNNVHEYLRATVPGLGITTSTGAAGGITHSFGGTSSATPLVAGVAGLTISANPNLSALEVISLLKRTASKDLSANGYPRTPAATFDPNPTWDVSPIAPFDAAAFQNVGSADGTWSPWYGHGRVDAQAAVAEALRLAQPNVPSGQVIRRASTPAAAIPDNDPAGLRDSMLFEEGVTASSLKVSVNITHTYIGDLRILLVAPSGTQVVLHDRNGGNTPNLVRTFDVTTTPGLAALLGQSIRGNWLLTIQDLARVDVGTLNRWEMEIAPGAGTLVEAQDAPGVTIPDNAVAGIERTLNVTRSGSIRDVEVALDITHTYIGDLRVVLVSPAGTEVRLHDRAGGSQDNLLQTYKSTTLPTLAALRGQSMTGTWRLRVADLEAVDVGKLNRWTLRIAG